MASSSSEVKPAPIAHQDPPPGRGGEDSRPTEHAGFGTRIFLRGRARWFLIGAVVLVVGALAAVGISRVLDRAEAAKGAALAEDARDSYASGEFDAAILDLESAIEIDPSNAGSHLLLAQAYEASGDLASAEAAYRTSLELDPKQPQAEYNLAIIHKSQGKTSQAIQDLERAVQLSSGFVAARVTLGDLYAEKGDTTAAREQYEAVLQMEPYGTDLEAIRGKLGELE